MAQTVLLALDADSAGQEAMLKASSLAAKRKLELRVVPLAAGMDPAEMVQRDGAEAIKAAVGKAVPFVRFRVERALASGDDSSPGGDATGSSSSCARSSRRCPRARCGWSSHASSPGAWLCLSGWQRRCWRAAGMVAGAGAEVGRAGAGSAQASRQAPASASLAGQGERPRRRDDELTRREDTERAFLALCNRLAGGGRAGARGPRPRGALLERAAAPRGGSSAGWESARGR